MVATVALLGVPGVAVVAGTGKYAGRQTKEACK
jgi:hypothetical protein